MNNVALSGRLAADIREHYTKTGKHVIHFPLAVQKGFQRNEEIPDAVSDESFSEALFPAVDDDEIPF